MQNRRAHSNDEILILALCIFVKTKTSAMLLINALICNAETLEFKIHLRSDFARCGLTQAIEVSHIRILCLKYVLFFQVKKRKENR